jgi:hypothetical protein
MNIKRFSAMLAAVIGLSALIATNPAETVNRAEASTSSNRLVPLDPCRLLDTRTSGGAMPVDGRRTLKVTELCGIPADARAVAVTLTSVRATRAGWLSIIPAGMTTVSTSTVNVLPGEIRPNGAIVALSAGGEVTIVNNAGGHVVLDVTAAFVPASRATEGRFVPTPIQRVLDTRQSGRPARGENRLVRLPSSIPADATALAINLTTSGASGHGLFTVFPARPGAEVPTVSMLNTDAPGQTRGAGMIVPVTSDGFYVHTSAGDHIIVDIAGYFTGPTAADSGSGLLVPITPVRLADTRRDGPQIFRGGTREWGVTQPLGNANIGAVVANVTMVRSDGDGWALAYPSRTPMPNASTVNARPGATVANMSIVPVSTAGLAVYSPTGSQIVVDVTAWFTTTSGPVPGVLPPPENKPPGPGRTLIVTDSTGASLRWFPESQQYLTGFPWVLDAESCRRTADLSCRGREGYAPPNTVQAIRNAPGQFETIVVMTGYNDWNTRFASAIDQVVWEARRKGARQIVWLILRTGHLYSMPGQNGNSSTNHAWNNYHLRQGTLRHPDLKLIDWNAHSFGRPDWFTFDKVHISASGAIALARFISAELARIS